MNAQREMFQDFRIEAGGEAWFSGRGDLHWFRVYEGDDEDEVFSLVMRVTDRAAYAHPSGRDAATMARLEGQRWVHGLIQLARFERGKDYEYTRTVDWEPHFGIGDLSEEELRAELLAALHRMSRAQQSSSAVISLDVGGIAAVLGVPKRTVREVLSDLLVEGLAEPFGGSYSHAPVDGACRITAEGLRAFRAAQGGFVSPARMITVDDVESFTAVRGVSVESVAELIDGTGLLRIPEAEVKQALCAIVGEPFEHKDWGGERSDVFTTRVLFEGRRTPTAMLLKGPAVGSVLYPSGLGKRGDQDLRLFAEPADLFIVQFNGRIESTVHLRLRTQAEHRAAQGQRTIVCVMDGPDTARLLRAYRLL